MAKFAQTQLSMKNGNKTDDTELLDFLFCKWFLLDYNPIKIGLYNTPSILVHTFYYLNFEQLQQPTDVKNLTRTAIVNMYLTIDGMKI